MDHIIPANVGVRAYTCRRDRAEVSIVTFEYYDSAASRWVIDNVCEPEERKDIDVERPLLDPAALKAHDRKLLVRINAFWKPDDHNHWPMDRIEIGQYSDRAEFYMYAKPSDTNATAISKIIYDRPLPGTNGYPLLSDVMEKLELCKALERVSA